MMRIPRSLGGRTAFVLLLGLIAVQVAGLTIHALDRVDIQNLSAARLAAERTRALVRTALFTPLEDRAEALADIDLPDGMAAEIGREPAARGGPPLSLTLRELLRAGNAGLGPPPPPPPPRAGEALSGPPPPPPPPLPMPRQFRPREGRDFFIAGLGTGQNGYVLSARMPDGMWLNVRTEMPPPRPWHSPTFLIAFIVMTAMAALLTLWAVRRLTRPVRLLAEAAERLGRDVNAPPLPEAGPSEVATAAAAFNTMAVRIRRFVQDRTEMLAAIGHDLRTPITRLRLRAEFMDDDEQRAKMLADLAEMEKMIGATLAFARDDAAAEPATPVDLAGLARTVVDEAADAAPDRADQITYDGPAHLTVRARPVALKRALANLVGNALAYGGAARVTLAPPARGQVRLTVEDEGPGIPAEEMERVFAPFHRLEASRNRETGGTGLGLPIARNILRAHGGDVTLANRADGGLAATMILPA